MSSDFLDQCKIQIKKNGMWNSIKQAQKKGQIKFINGNLNENQNINL